MRHRPVAVRALALIVAAGLLLPETGCITAERRANQRWNQVSLGMTREEVREALGEPDSISSEVWHYSYVSLPDPGKISTVTIQTLALVSLLGACALLMAYGSRHGGSAPFSDLTCPWPSGDGSASSGTVHFRVVFDPEGKVTAISGIEECDE